MPRKIAKRGQGLIYKRKDSWWCDYTAGGVRRRESCKTSNRDEALAYLKRKQGMVADGKMMTSDRVTVRDLLNLLLDDYDLRRVAQHYIATLKVKSILNPKLGNLKAVNLTTARVQEYIKDRLKSVKEGTVNRELGLLHRAFQIGYDRDPPLVGRVPSSPS